ncbi:MAG TPA: NF038122 family metalloprotease [Verrucomicrobiae bacterium]|nr:NF038122 family metalloprotease [Verrucomicrobiae bacterium]
MKTHSTNRLFSRSAGSLRAAWGFLAIAAVLPLSARALTFNLTYDSSTASAPAGFFTAFTDAIDFYQNTYDNSITINMDVGWGEIDGRSLNTGDLGQSQTDQQGFYSYSQIVTAFANNNTSAADATALANLPAAYPVSNAQFVMANAEAKAYGLLAGNASGIDGWVGFDSAATYTFDPNNRSVSGEYDFIGLAEHEISEVMGRYGLGQNGASSGRYSPIDLFRYLSAGNLDTTPANGDYFSIDGGKTVINTYNGIGGGDLSDWAGATPDSYNHSLSPDEEEPATAGDVTLMNVLGYNLTPVPEPSALALLPFGVLTLGCVRRSCKKS